MSFVKVVEATEVLVILRLIKSTFKVIERFTIAVFISVVLKEKIISDLFRDFQKLL